MNAQRLPKLAVTEMAGLCVANDEGVVKEMGKSRMSVDENDVKKVQSTLNNWINPFSPSDSDDISHLASGLTAPKKVEDDLLMAHEKGKKSMETFMRKRLMTSMIPYQN